MGQDRTHLSDAWPFLLALALHGLVRQPLELECKWMSKGHLTLRHHNDASDVGREMQPLWGCSLSRMSVEGDVRVGSARACFWVNRPYPSRRFCFDARGARARR